MTVKAILDAKGRDVVTIAASRTLREAVSLLAEHRIGALVVTVDDDRISGILSERDIVRAIGREGAEVLEKPVSAVMTARVQVCRESHTVNEVMQIMTEGRFRHLPVEKDGRLAGIVSIGDVVKRRIEEVEREAEEIRTYIATA
ncbi:CBS domain-containing protein [Chelativorans sp. SCAU2101]|mgnify:CR=1 FL=1|jgi:Predicted signal-transduction protein containing cAMP-binding and CBS domains|uniref:CBS domain-containing protein n=1 Tax=Chelativorans petroleitrophicus TaxID=2975484 RepID=A0A9X2XB29_9HYPH|nr:CBS domain-containing protein [Chelativorans petroleitrophicus]MCT8990960.1 CBS domain-containing protein [Chelativorans petroleitrophicus]